MTSEKPKRRHPIEPGWYWAKYWSRGWEVVLIIPQPGEALAVRRLGYDHHWWTEQAEEWGPRIKTPIEENGNA